MLGDPFNEKIARVLEACWKLGYFPERYKSAKTIVAVHTVPPNQVHLIGSTGLDSGLVLVERSVKERVGVLRDSGGGLLGTVLHTRQGLY